MDDRDQFRFVHDLYEFNDKNPALNIYYKSSELKSYEVGLRKHIPRELLVEILAFCMMPNHFHLMLREIRENGVTEFMRKLGTGYTNYFNNKYERVGSLFQGKYKSKLIKNEAHYIHLPHYIHLNPLKLIIPGWKDKGIYDLKRASKFLDEYKWSSYRDYTGNKNFPSIVNRKFYSEFFGGPKEYEKSLKVWLKNLPNNLTKSDFVNM
jgi:putative transposase